MKPKGLWYAIDEAWVIWCASEMPEWIAPPLYRYRLTLDVSRLLRLQTDRDVLNFNRAYSEPYPGSSSLTFINWRRVAATFAGIEVAPYHYSLRLSDINLLWYCGWDVSSGCVWDVAAVTGVELLPPLPIQEAIP
jgi:hypothetical protein